MEKPETQTMPHGLADDFIGERYVIDSQIGEGGFGSVYRATDTKIGGEVAIKLLDSEKSNDPAFVTRFNREVRLLRELRHPNTIRVFDAGVDDTLGVFYFSMELLEGKPLDAVIAENGAMPYDRVRTLAGQILASLDEAHSSGIVHRDVKPSNLFLCEYRGAPNHLKVLDFGIAKPVAESAVDLTATGALLCTPRYAAPELLRGGRPAPSADVYSVGLVLLELLTGETVVRGATVADVIVKQCSAKAHNVPSAVQDTPLGRAISRAVNKNAEARYRDAGEMLRALEHFEDESRSIPVPHVPVQNVPVPNIAVPNIAVPNIAVPSVPVPHAAVSSVELTDPSAFRRSGRVPLAASALALVALLGVISLLGRTQPSPEEGESAVPAESTLPEPSLMPEPVAEDLEGELTSAERDATRAATELLAGVRSTAVRIFGESSRPQIRGAGGAENAAIARPAPVRAEVADTREPAAQQAAAIPQNRPVVEGSSAAADDQRAERGRNTAASAPTVDSEPGPASASPESEGAAAERQAAEPREDGELAAVRGEEAEIPTDDAAAAEEPSGPEEEAPLNPFGFQGNH